jgi:hypothetical protein
LRPRILLREEEGKGERKREREKREGKREGERERETENFAEKDFFFNFWRHFLLFSHNSSFCSANIIIDVNNFKTFAEKNPPKQNFSFTLLSTKLERFPCLVFVDEATTYPSGALFGVVLFGEALNRILKLWTRLNSWHVIVGKYRATGSSNGKESTVNRALGGSTYPG